MAVLVEQVSQALHVVLLTLKALLKVVPYCAGHFSLQAVSQQVAQEGSPPRAQVAEEEGALVGAALEQINEGCPFFLSQG